MILEWLKSVPWEHPGIVGPVAAALTIGLLKIIPAIIKRKRRDGAAPNITTTVNPDITVSPQTNIENNPSNVFEPSVTYGLDEKAVGDELSKALNPHSARIESRIEALGEQLAQLAPKEPLPDSKDPLKVYAVEFYNAGLDAYMKGEVGQALGHWLDTLKLDPEFAKAHFNLGCALQKKGELDAAIEHWRTALRIDPDYADAHGNLGVALADKGDLDAAIEQYHAALRIDPDYALAHNNLGAALEAKGDLDGAIEHYNAALRIDPDHSLARNNLKIALAAKAKLDPTD